MKSKCNKQLALHAATYGLLCMTVSVGGNRAGGYNSTNRQS